MRGGNRKGLEGEGRLEARYKVQGEGKGVNGEKGKEKGREERVGEGKWERR